jgi:hypothetical protein
MPVRWDPWSVRYPRLECLSPRHAIICQSTPSCYQDSARIRYVIIFITGNFTLDEANSFAIELFDNPGDFQGNDVPDKDLFFENPLDICSTAFSTITVPEPLKYIVDNFSTVDFTDEYTFHLLHHSSAFFFHEQSRIEDLIDKRAKKIQGEWARLLAAEV